MHTGRSREAKFDETDDCCIPPTQAVCIGGDGCCDKNGYRCEAGEGDCDSDE